MKLNVDFYTVLNLVQNTNTPNSFIVVTFYNCYRNKAHLLTPFLMLIRQVVMAINEEQAFIFFF